EDGIRDRNVTGVQTCALPIFTVMRPIGIVVLIGAKILTGYTHPRDRNLTLFLETPNHFYQGREEDDLLRCRECLRRSRQPIRHRSEERRVGKECRSRL